ncbi:cytochrome P450 [Actinocorallia sp. A-T 12471]|uniref:cytochrome P450 n=1 Tax=Actinocorallia sp. A-T 12471 TaxID=3089813 RepID=UPI0029CE6566|nr:cytochrome P450 [Actinocorallia sp. A-T 12471]MDX6741663.1 cytochrome P450 [Actinocorallia sp. A-T 12471]
MTAETDFTLFQFLREGFDPVRDLARARAEQPVYPMPIPGGQTAWLLTRYADVRDVLADARRFSNDFAGVVSLGSDQADPGGLGFSDPPEHTRLRRLLTPEFTMRRLARLRPRIAAIVAAHLDAMEAAGPPADLVRDFALPIPSLVVCELLGVPAADHAELTRVSAGRFDLSAGPEASIQAVNDAMRLLTGLVARERQAPGDGLLGALLREHGDEVSDRELASLADGILTGGHDTSTSMLALGALWLTAHPDELVAVAEKDGYAEEVVDELLRYLTVVQVAFPRFAREDVVVGGQPIAKGEMVLCSLSAANRDPERGDDLDRAVPGRPFSHLAFGHGIHRCVGAPLARMELEIAFTALARRFPTFRPAIPAAEISFRQIAIVYGLDALPVTW